MICHSVTFMRMDKKRIVIFHFIHNITIFIQSAKTQVRHAAWCAVVLHASDSFNFFIRKRVKERNETSHSHKLYYNERMNEWIKCCNAFRFWIKCGISISFPEGCGLQNFRFTCFNTAPASTGQLNFERKNLFFTVVCRNEKKKKYLNRFTFEKKELQHDKR